MGMRQVTLHARLKRGWSIEKALLEPVNKSKRNNLAKRSKL